MEFINVVGAGIFWGISRELEVLKAGGEEGGMGPRVEVVVGHGAGEVRGPVGKILNARPGLEGEKEKNINYGRGMRLWTVYGLLVVCPHAGSWL